MNLEQLEAIAETNQLAIALSQDSLADYLKICIIDSLPSPRPFGEIAEPWQWEEVLNPVIPAIEHLGLSKVERQRRKAYDGPLGFWNTYPRGHDKSSCIARMVNYLLRFARREVPVIISVAAADQGQAKKIRNCMEREATLNPWIGKYLEINKYDAKGPGGELTILSSDAGSAYGGGSDLIICDEVTHWKNDSLWIAMTSESIKRSHCVMFVITNAGYIGSWQHKAMVKFRTDPRWYVNDKPGFRAKWMSQEALRSVREGIIASTGSVTEAQRLIDNIWSSSRQGSVFDPLLIEKIFRPDGPLWISAA